MSILIIQDTHLSCTLAPQQITSWHLGKTKSYPGMASRENSLGSECVKSLKLKTC